MSERFLLTDLEILISKLAQTGINTPYTTAANFVKGLVNANQPPFPVRAPRTINEVGNGRERQKIRKGWIVPVELPFGGILNCETAARFGMRAHAGTRTLSAELTPSGSGAFDITKKMQVKSQGRVPELSTIGFDLGGYKFFFPDMAVDSFEIAFEGSNEVTWAARLRNTGVYRLNYTQAALEAMGFDTATATALKLAVAAITIPTTTPEHHYMHPAVTKCTFSDGTTVDFAADGDLIGGACSVGNGIVVKQMPGDPALVATDRKKGFYARDIHRGARVPAARLKTSLPSDLYHFVLEQNDTDITSLTYLFRSDEPIDDSAYFYEFEQKFLLAQVETIAADPDGDEGAVTMNFYPEQASDTDGYSQLRIRTDNTTLE